MAYIRASIVCCVLCTVFPALALGQSLFDSTEFSEKSSGIEIEAGEDLALRFNTLAYRKGEATRVGLNYMPKEFTDITYCSNKLLNQIEEAPNLAPLTPRWAEFIESVGIDTSNCKSLVRGTRHGNIGSRQFGTLPNMMVVIGLAPFDKSKLKAKPVKLGAIEYYNSANGAVVGFPKPDVMLYGTKNEVLNGLLLKNGGNSRQPGFEWIDFSKYDSIKLSKRDPPPTRTAYFTQDGIISGRATLYRNSGAAKLEKERQEIKVAFFKSDNPARFLATRETEMQKKRFIVPNLNNKQRADLINGVKKAQKHQRPVLSTTISQSGPVLIVGQTLGKEEPYQISYNVLEELLPNFEKPRQRKDIFFSTSAAAKFERYEFDQRNGTGTETSIVNGFGFGNSRIYSTYRGIYDNLPTADSQMAQSALNNTSSRVLRNHIIRQLSKSETAQALMILGIEAHRFDLASASMVLDAKEDDEPQLLGKPRKSAVFQFEALEKTLAYYLSNPGDPILLTAVCKIAEDLKLSKLTSKLQSVAQNSSSDQVKTAAKEALNSISDSTLVSKNILAPPADADTALRWIKGTDRAKKAASLVWVMRNSELGERHSEFVSALIFMLDDGNYFNETLVVLKKICKPTDGPLFHQVLKLAIDDDSNFKMRQEYSLLRIVEMVMHLKDQEGIKLAYSIGGYSLTKFMKLYAAKSDVQTRTLMEQMLDQYIQEYVANPSSRATLQLSSYDFTASQKTVLKKFVRQAWDTQSEVIKHSRFWDLVESTAPFQAEDVPLLVGLIFNEAGFHTKTVEFLIANKSGVEDLAIAQMEAGKTIWSDKDAINLLTAIGTAKSAPYLEKLKNKK